MYTLRRVLILLMRICYCRGFGIQSPSAYHFVRYVINEHYPYYAYAELKSDIPALSGDERRLAELYFRISNYAQAERWLYFTSAEDVYSRYVKRGCNKTQFLVFRDVEECDEAEISSFDVIHFASSLECSNTYEYIINRACEKTILIVEGIKSSGSARRFWSQIESDNRTGVTFDLYYCGIVFFDSKRPKQSYKISF